MWKWRVCALPHVPRSSLSFLVLASQSYVLCTLPPDSCLNDSEEPRPVLVPCCLRQDQHFCVPLMPPALPTGCPRHQGCGHQVSALSFPKNLVKRNVLFSANHSFPGLIALGANNQAKDAFSGLHMSNLIFGITFSSSQHRSSKTISLRTETNPS